MSKRKGLSVDEKLDRLKDLFHETRDVYTLKQLEPLAQKQKGIVLQSVKEIVVQLVADNIVQQEKIGVGTYLWSFPSASVQGLRVRAEDLGKEVEALKKTKDQLQKDLTQARVGREESEERAVTLKRLEGLQKQKAALDVKLRAFSENDPEVIEHMDKRARLALGAANRWTDNVFVLKRHAQRSMGVDSATFHTNFGPLGIDAEFDYPPALEE